MSLDALIEAVLFWQAESINLPKLAQMVGRSEAEVTASLDVLEKNLEARGVQLLRKDNEVMLGTHPEASGLIERLAKEELSRDLGKASLETLTTVLYKGPISRAEIDYIRGVNSSFILRHLMIRDLVERVVNPDDARSFLYKPTFNLLQHLGVRQVEDLPDYATLDGKLAEFVEQSNNKETN